LDDDVYNLWTVLQANHQELKEAIEQMPLSHSLFNYWVRNKETDPIKKATRFLMLSNFSLYSSGVTFRVIDKQHKGDITP
jgi:DNA adenine methylase